MRRRRSSLFGVFLILAASSLFGGCPATFAPTNPLAAGGASSTVASNDRDTHDSEGTPSSVSEPAAAPVSTGILEKPADTPVDVASNTSTSSSGIIAAAGDQADAGKERLTITFREVHYGHNFAGILPDPPGMRYLSANPNGPTDLPLVLAYRSANSQLLKGYPVGCQIRMIFYPEVITQPTTYVDVSVAFDMSPAKFTEGPNVLFDDLNLGKGTLELYAYEDPIYDETGSYTMGHTDDYHEGGLTSFADGTQMANFIGDLHVRHLGTFKAIFGYPTAQP